MYKIDRRMGGGFKNLSLEQTHSYPRVCPAVRFLDPLLFPLPPINFVHD